MTGSAARALPAGSTALFIVWGPPSHGPRSRVFSRELGIEVHFIFSTRRRGRAIAPLKYGYQAVRTLWLLFRRRPQIVFVQSPPSFASIFVALYCGLTGGRFVIDAHSGAFQSPYWTRPAWLYRHMARRAVATIVTNEHFAAWVRSSGGKALVLRDIPTTFPEDGVYPIEAKFNVTVVNTFTFDEPLEEVLAAATALGDVQFHITGDTSRPGRNLPSNLPPNARFTGYLSDEDYYALMRAGDAVMCLTTRDHTMQRGACEALSLGKPIITSNWPLLTDYFHKGAVYVDNTAPDIRRGVEEMVQQHGRYAAEIRDLQVEQQREWEHALSSLSGLLSGEPGNPSIEQR